jgi:hypothetical protein
MSFIKQCDQEKIVCAAIRKDQIIIVGLRHFDEFMIEQLKFNNSDMIGWECGFMTNDYRFVTRAEAWDIAKKENQLHWGKDRSAGLLFSEDLY